MCRNACIPAAREPLPGLACSHLERVACSRRPRAAVGVWRGAQVRGGCRAVRRQWPLRQACVPHVERVVAHHRARCVEIKAPGRWVLLGGRRGGEGRVSNEAKCIYC